MKHHPPCPSCATTEPHLVDEVLLAAEHRRTLHALLERRPELADLGQAARGPLAVSAA